MMPAAAYPFAAVYDYFAKTMVERGLLTDPLLPAMFLVGTKNGEVDLVESLPVAHLFGSNGGKEHLGQILRAMMPKLPPFCCMVVISEAWQKTTPHDAPRPQDLSDDPDAVEVVVIMLHRGDETVTGALPIGPGRTLRYAPLTDDVESLGGRLTVGPGEPADPRKAQAAAQDALHKARRP